MTVILPFPITVKARLKHIFLVEFDNLFHPNHDVRQDFFIKEEYHYLNVSQVGRFTVYDNLDCTFECLGNPFCLSKNLAAYKGADGTLWCELLSSEKFRKHEEYKRHNSWHHFFVKVHYRSVFFTCTCTCTRDNHCGDARYCYILIKKRIFHCMTYAYNC